jgi:cytochrome c biogenesis protein CcmG, thiol:disulfide interchange protein DsbE
VERTWSAAVHEVLRSAARHKVLSGVIALCVALSLAVIAWVGATSRPASGAVQAGSVGPDGAGALIPAGQPVAPAFSLPRLGKSGERVSLTEYAGKPLIVNFFASWCTPCQQETPMLATFYRSERGRVAVVGLDENDLTAHALAFAKAKGVTYPVGWDPGVVAGSAYDVAAIPQTFFLNVRHRIVYRVFGAVTSAELTRGIALATGPA